MFSYDLKCKINKAHWACLSFSFPKTHSWFLLKRLFCFSREIAGPVKSSYFKHCTTEHTELLTNILKYAKNKQQQLVVMLFDLKNAWEVHHNLIKNVLKYHHIPPSIINFINSLYSDYFILITTKDFITNLIKVNCGVLQRDCLLPLIFNLCVNTLIKSIENKKVGYLGYILDRILSPHYCFQSADDTAIITALEGDNQLLFNLFTKWTSWADYTMISATALVWKS